MCRAEPASRSARPVFGSFRSAVWNTATFASRVFDGLPSSPRPRVAPHHRHARAVRAAVNRLRRRFAQRHRRLVPRRDLLPDLLRAALPPASPSPPPPASRAQTRRRLREARLRRQLRQRPQRRRRQPRAAPTRDAQRLIQNVQTALRAPARPVAPTQRQPAQQRQRRRRARAAPVHRRAAAPARRRLELRVQLRQNLRCPPPPRQPAERPASPARTPGNPDPPRSVPRQRSRNPGDDDSSRPTASDRNDHFLLALQRLPRQHPVRHRDSLRFGCRYPQRSPESR